MMCMQIQVQDAELFELESMVKQLLSAAVSQPHPQHQHAEAAAVAAKADAAAVVGDGTSAKAGHTHHGIQICAVAGGGAGS
jgi:hypothetical protein